MYEEDLEEGFSDDSPASMDYSDGGISGEPEEEEGE
jgi:hypothetical protein